MLKRTLSLIVALLLAAAGSTGVALAKPSNGARLDDPSLTPEYKAQLQKLTEEKEAINGIDDNKGGVSILALNKYGLQTRSVTNYQQERTYWCGPASSRQALSFHKKSSGSTTALPSQTTLAGKIGTTTSGSTTTKIASALNSYKDTFGSNFDYIASDISNTSNPYETFVNRIGTQLRSITQDPTTPIILVQTAHITRYGGHTSRHYITISGINDDISPMKMRDVDSNYDNAYYGIYWDNVGTTTSKGLCMACYKADTAGSNLAMAW